MPIVKPLCFVVANAWLVPVVSYILTGRPRWMGRMVD